MAADEDAAIESAPRVPTLGEKFDPAEHREHTRARLAAGLALLLAVVGILLIVLTAADALTLEEAKDLAVVVLSPIVVLTGTALGFYFGVYQSGP
jgi:hypothetical protein